MPLPLAAIAAAGTSALAQLSRDQLAKGQARTSALSRGAQILGAVTGGGAGGFLGGIVRTGSGAVVDIATRPNVSLGTRIAAGPTGETVRLMRQLSGNPVGTILDPTTSHLFRRRSRRMDVCNIKALRRAARRMSGFTRIAKQMVRLEKKAGLKKPRRRR